VKLYIHNANIHSKQTLRFMPDCYEKENKTILFLFFIVVHCREIR